MTGTHKSEIAKQAFLKISSNEKELIIKHRVSFKDKLTWVIFMFMFMITGAWLISIPFFKPQTESAKIATFLFGLIFLSLSIYVFFIILMDRIKINKKEISIRYKIKQISIPLDYCREVEMKTEIISYRNSISFSVTHYIQTDQHQIPIFKSQMDQLYADRALKLGKEISKEINQRILKLH